MSKAALNTLNYQGVVMAVAHEKFKRLPIERHQQQVVFDIKSFLSPETVDERL